MSASKYPGPTSARRKLGPLAVRPAARRPEPGAAVVAGSAAAVQEKVLAEIRHELGNFFHKLYYWSDYLKEKPARQPADSTATQMLERTIRNLEDFLKVSLDYFHPTQLSFTRMAVPDLVEGLLFQARAHLNGTPLAAQEPREWGDAALLVDPGHLSQAFAVAVRHLTKQVGPESSVRIAVERSTRRDCPGLEVAFILATPNEASPLFRTSEAGIEWAVAQKVVALHGGELSEITGDGAEKTIILFLPLQPAGGAEV
jgi:signal transduction histidine kinase